MSCQALSRRGCHASALEVTKLLLALDPEDPVGGLLLLDYLALRAGEVVGMWRAAHGYHSGDQTVMWWTHTHLFIIAGRIVNVYKGFKAGALDPEDPVGGVLLLDYLALRAGEDNAILPVGGGWYQQGLYLQVPC